MPLAKSNLTARLTQNALEGLPVVHADLVELCQIVTVNANQLVKAQQRICELEALMVAPDEEIGFSVEAANDAPKPELVDVVIQFRGHDSIVKVPKDQVVEFVKHHNGKFTN
tara:strand:- start:1820 stop:2155 length:336 start_codon:yes stop_codon:yes gene_type:complete